MDAITRMVARRVCSAQGEKRGSFEPALVLGRFVEPVLARLGHALGLQIERDTPGKRRWALVPKRVNIFFFICPFGELDGRVGQVMSVCGVFFLSLSGFVRPALLSPVTSLAALGEYVCHNSLTAPVLTNAQSAPAPFFRFFAVFAPRVPSSFLASNTLACRLLTSPSAHRCRGHRNVEPPAYLLL